MKPLTILIVDDLPINLKLLRAQLEGEGHTVVEAHHGEEGLELLDRQKVDVIVSDILMPVMDGYRFCQEVRKSERHRHLPFIAYTSTYVSPSDEKLSLDLGADRYLLKPAPIAKMMRTIEEALADPGRRPTTILDTADVLKEYNSGLVTKLEKKNIELTHALGQLELQNTALETAADAILITDAEGVIFWVNPAFTTITGYSAEEAIGKTPRILKSGEHTEAFYSTFWKTIGAGKTWRSEFINRHKDGHIYYGEHTVTPVRDAAGTITHFVGIMHDITERKLTQDELHESERRFREMLDNLDLASVMVDRDGLITYCNDYFLRLTGWQREDVIGVNWFARFVPPERADEARKRFPILLGGHLRHTTNEIMTRSGARRLLQWNNSLVYSPSGDVIGTASIAEDITDRVRLENQLLRAQRLESLGTLAGGIAHDLNNLLLPILMGVTLLKRFDPNEASKKAIENIERSVRRGSELVKQVLLFARGGDTPRKAVQVAEIIREIEAIIGSTFPKDIRIEVSAAPDLHPVTGNATQLSQVLLNLCVNARDAMPHGGQIMISATNADSSGLDAVLQKGGPYVVLEVADTGEGIPKEIIDRIFDPFYTTKEVGKGTGLGLSTAQGIITSHGGFLSVSSKLGEGSTFTIHLPAHAAVAVPVTVAEDAAPCYGNGELILVVDDDASVASVTRQTLEVFGYEVLTAEDGAQAIGIFSHRQADIALVLTDMAMPVIDGSALIAALNRMAPEVRIIATTGNPSSASMAKIARTGVTRVLTKPYTAEQLLAMIAEALEKRT
jgi:two-component system cell cycle sensor histidine kinase/response regulator CckA